MANACLRHSVCHTDGMELDEQSSALAGMALMAAVFLALALVELARPRRELTLPRGRRWRTNLALFAIDTALVRLTIPLLMVGMAQTAQEREWGLFNALEMPLWLEFALAIVLLDLALWFQHLATHRVPLLWRLHKVHHSDPDFDITTAARFHPLEIGLSMLYKMAVVAMLGPTVLAVFVFEAAFNVATIFTHANFSFPPAFDRILRTVIATPDMHRIHHSTLRRETDSNYGTMLSGWDRLFRTYTRGPERGPDATQIGLAPYQDARPAKLGWSLVLPFRSEPEGEG